MTRKPQTSQQTGGMLALIGRMLLVVSLWNAPFPMVHAHGADPEDSEDSTAFAEHLARFHTDVRLNSHVDFGWHWHLVLPADDHSECDCPDGHPHGSPKNSRGTVASIQVPTTIVSQLILTTLEWISGVNSTTGLASAQRSRVPHQFLETYLGSVSVGTLLRVARC